MSYPIFHILETLRLPRPKRIIHVGANDGWEFDIYRSMGAEIVLYIEPIPDVYERLKARLNGATNHYPLPYLCSNVDGEEILFNVSSNQGESSSIFPLGNHAKLYPDIKYVNSLAIKSRTLDSILTQEFTSVKFDLLVLDTQGSELRVLQGASKLLQDIRYVYAEVSEDPLYEGGCTQEDITGFLKFYGLKLKNLTFNYKNWGDALYAKKTPLPSEPTTNNLSLNKSAQQSSLSQWSTPNDAQGAVNGIKTGMYGFHTECERNPWWQVDLAETFALIEVRVYNRLDNASERIRTLQVLISVDGVTWQQVYVHDGWIFGGIDGNPLLVCLPSLIARYVRLQLNDVNCLHLDEVEVYGFPLT